MKIPTVPALNVAPESVRSPTGNVPAPRGYEALTQGAAGVDRLGSQTEELYQQQEHKFRVLQASEAQQAYQRAITESSFGSTETPQGDPNAPVPDVPSMSEGEFGAFLAGPQPEPKTKGFLSFRGEHALANQDEYLKELEKKRQEIAKGIKDEKAREMFLKGSEELRISTERQYQSHTASQLEAAKRADAKASLGQTLSDVSLDPENDEKARLLTASTAARAEALALSREDAAAEVAAIQAEVASARAKILIKKERWDKAEEVVNESGKALGIEGVRLLEKIEDGRSVGQMTELAQSMINTARQEDGSINEVSAWKGAAALDGETQKKLAPVLTAYLAHERKAWDEETEKITNGAASQFLLLQRDYGPRAWGAFARSDIGEQLRTRNWKVYNQLQNGVESDLAREERQSRVRANDAQARREQAEIDKIIQNRWETVLKRDPNANLSTFLATEGRQGSRWIPSELEKDQATRQELAQRKLLIRQTEFEHRALQNADGFLPKIEGTPQQKAAAKAARDAFQAKAGRAYAKAALAQKEGADLSEKEATEIIADLVATATPHTDDAAARAAEAILDRANRAQPPSMLQAPPSSQEQLPAEKAVRSYLVSPDKKKRRPVYSDGSVGEVEMNPRGR